MNYLNIGLFSNFDRINNFVSEVEHHIYYIITFYILCEHTIYYINILFIIYTY